MAYETDMTSKEMKEEIDRLSYPKDRQDLIITFLNGEYRYFLNAEQLYINDKNISFVYYTGDKPLRACYQLDNISGYEYGGVEIDE